MVNCSKIGSSKYHYLEIIFVRIFKFSKGIVLLETRNRFIGINLEKIVESYSKIQSLPKVELHRHIEGCITPEFLRDYLPKYHPSHELLHPGAIDSLFIYNNFTDFLNAWSTVMKLLTEEEMFRDMARYLVSQLKEENIVYAELLFSPQPFMKAGMRLEVILDMMYREINASEIETRLIIDFVRNFGPEEVWNTLDQLIMLRRQNFELSNWIVGVSIGGDEVNFQADLFTHQFAKARENGLRSYAHAGEWAGPESIWKTIEQLKVERLGHGVRAIDDEKLQEYLIEHEIGLDISITSNYLTNAVEPQVEHPVKKLYEKGIKISLNTDDPGFFHTDLNQEYQKFMELGFSVEDIMKINEHAVEMSFLDSTTQETIRKKINGN